MPYKPRGRWTAASFMIVVRNEKGANEIIWETGEIWNCFGIHGSYYDFVLTHLPTGYRIGGPLRFFPATKKNLKRWAQELEKEFGDRLIFSNPQKAKKFKTINELADKFIKGK